MLDTLRPIILAFSIFVIVLAMALLPINNKATAFHSQEEIQMFHQQAAMAAIDSTQYFPTAGLCKGCHGYDPQAFALVDNNGNDVNMTDDWRATMMANSAKDPFWRAKVSHEILVNPDFSLETQDKCTSCHAPMGHYTAHYRGEPHYTMEDLLSDTIGLDGVSCGACHQMSPDSLGDLFSGLMVFDTNRIQFGPYLLPFAAPMANFVGFTPTYSPHIHDAGLCASCHTLVTQTFEDGEPNGDTFVEQATYHEWLNSNYNTGNISCQSCHLPQIEDSVIISDNYNALGGRQPYGLHELVGGNTFMLKLMKDNRQALGIDAEEEHFDETIFSTLDMLQNRTLNTTLEVTNKTLDSLYLDLYLLNKAGHKFPSGYPSRRAFVELLVITTGGDTLFQSGVLNDEYEVAGHDPYFEPHYNVINDPEQVQIYEIVPADVDGNFTSVLENAAFPLKDNRLPPLGFTTSHAVYDTTEIIGNAISDSNFNYDESGQEGSASDHVYYHIPRHTFNGGFVNVSARVYYQSLPPKWMEEIFSVSTPEIEIFRTMYDEADQSPVLISTVTIDSVFLDFIIDTDNPSPAQALIISPNPTKDGWIHCRIPDNLQLESISVFNLNGQLLDKHHKDRFQMPEKQGIYIVKINTDKGSVVRKVFSD